MRMLVSWGDFLGAWSICSRTGMHGGPLRERMLPPPGLKQPPNPSDPLCAGIKGLR